MDSDGAAASRPAGDLSMIAQVLDPILVPMGFASAQIGASAGRGQVIFCRGDWDDSDDGCIDLVLDVEASPDWHIVDVRYYGFASDRWHLDFSRDADIVDQVRGLARSLPHQLTP